MRYSPQMTAAASVRTGMIGLKNGQIMIKGIEYRHQQHYHHLVALLSTLRTPMLLLVTFHAQMSLLSPAHGINHKTQFAFITVQHTRLKMITIAVITINITITHIPEMKLVVTSAEVFIDNEKFFLCSPLCPPNMIIVCKLGIGSMLWPYRPMGKLTSGS